MDGKILIDFLDEVMDTNEISLALRYKAVALKELIHKSKVDPVSESEKDEKVSVGMKKLVIHQYQAKRIEDAFRLVSNHFHSQHKKTCLDRDITWCRNTIKNVLEGKPLEFVERF